MRALVLCVVLISLIAAAPAPACYFCKSSPDGMSGFCDPSANRGWNDCSEYIKDPFNGTSCKLEGNTCPYGVIGGGGSDPGDCWWTDLDGNCILAL